VVGRDHYPVVLNLLAQKLTLAPPATLWRLSIVKAPGSEKVEESVSLGAVFLYLAAPELPERAHDQLYLRQVRATPRAGPPVRFAALMITPGQGAVPVGGDELHRLPARHVGR